MMLLFIRQWLMDLRSHSFQVFLYINITVHISNYIVCFLFYAQAFTISSATSTAIWASALAASDPAEETDAWASASICTDESSLIVIEPDDTKNFLVAPSSAYTVTTPGDNTANAGTWLGKMPKLPEKLGTSTCFTDAFS